MNELQDLKDKIYVDPSTMSVRPYLIKFIKLRTEHAKQLSKEELLAREGFDAVSDICGAIAHNSANVGVVHDDWLNEKAEPLLSEILDVSAKLDADDRNLEEWDKLFELVERLK